MARYYSDQLISGRVGNQVFLIRNGKTYIRAYRKKKRVNSAKQRMQQARMRATSKFLSPFKRVLTIGYQDTFNTGISPFSKAVKYHFYNSLVESPTSTNVEPLFEVDLQKVQLSQGTIEPPIIHECLREGNVISLTWESSLGGINNRFFDQVVLVVYTPGLKVISDYDIGSRINGKGFFILPDEYDKPVHLWVFYFSGQRSANPSSDHVSNSVYLGEI